MSLQRFTSVLGGMSGCRFLYEPSARVLVSTDVVSGDSLFGHVVRQRSLADQERLQNFRAEVLREPDRARQQQMMAVMKRLFLKPGARIDFGHALLLT